MLPTRARTRRTAAISIAVATLAGLTAGPMAAVAPVARTLVPIGSDYQADTLELFARQAAHRDTSGRVVILVLPITYSLSADSSKASERKKNLTLADNRRAMVQDACLEVKSPTQTCATLLVPTLVRGDAYLQSNLDFFSPDVDGMYVLGGDQTVAMRLVAGTPLEGAMTDAYEAGAVFGGNSAGDAVQSLDMINGYTGSNGPAESLRQGAVDVWTYDGPGDLERGLLFGMQAAIMDQHVFEYGRTGRSLNVAVTSGKPVLGMDAATGGVVVDGTSLSDVTGDTSGYVIDPVALGATGTFAGPNDTLAARRVAVHVIPPGGFGYEFGTNQPTVGGARQAAPTLVGRSYPAIATPAGSGPLLVSGGIVGSASGLVGQRFLQLAGGSAARIVVLAAGYPRSTDAQADAKAIAAALQPGVTATVRWVVLDDGKTNQAAAASLVAGATGIFLTSPDRSRIAPALVAQATVIDAVWAHWTTGATLLADDAAAAALGTTFIADGISADVEASAPLDMLADGVAIGVGLGWVSNLDVQPRLLPDQNWGQLLRLTAARPGTLAVGIDVETALEISGGTARALGENAAVVLDGRSASFGTGTNTSLAARWIVLDSFVNGQTLAP